MVCIRNICGSKDVEAENFRKRVEENRKGLMLKGLLQNATALSLMSKKEKQAPKNLPFMVQLIMSSNLLHHKNYTEFGETYQLVLPLCLEGLIPENESVRLLSHGLEELDYTLLYQAYSAKGRNPAVDPKTMFKILTYAYSQNIYSSRDIEKACRRDINFMWHLAGQKAPDHSTIARFRTGFLANACEDLFYQMIRRLADMEELSKETVFIDGTKLEACANKYTFVWRKSVGKWEEKMFAKIETALQMMNHEYMQSFGISKETRTSDLQKIVDYLKQFCQINNIAFVYGRGKESLSTSVIWNFFKDFWTVRFYMTCIIPVLAAVTVIPKQMWMPHSCI